MTICDNYDSAASRLESSKTNPGKETIDRIMEPIRKMKEEEKTATGIQKTELVEKISSHYSDVPQAKMTPEKTEITKAMLADSDVKEYIHSMSIDEFAETRMELQTTFGGAQARIMEIEFKDAKLKSLGAELESIGKNTPAVKQEISTMGARGILSDKDLDTLRALEKLKTFDDNIITTGTARKTYSALKSELGDNITNEIFAGKVNKNIEKLQEVMKEESLLNRKLSKQEKQIVDDLLTGKRQLDANALEATTKMIEKADTNVLKRMTSATDPLRELDGQTREAIQRNGWSNTKKGTVGLAAIGGATWLFGVTIPDKLNSWGQMGLTNAAEMSALFGQFDKDTSSMRLLELWFPTGARQEAMNLWLEATKHYIGTMDTLYKIPIYGDWLKGTTYVGYASAKGSLGNLDTVLTALENKGLAIRDNTQQNGWRQTTDAEKKELYSKNPSMLFQNDKEFIRENCPWTDKTNIFAENGKEYTPEQVMALYYAEKNEHGVDILKMGMASQDLQDESTMKTVREYGRKHDTAQKETTGSSTTSKTTPTLTTEQQQWFKQSQGLTDEQIAYRMARGDTAIPDGKGGWINVQGRKTVDIPAGTGMAGGSSGSSGGSGGETAPTGREAQLQQQLKSGEQSLDQETLSSMTKNGKVDIAKLKANGGTIEDAADLNRATTIAGFKDETKRMVNNKKIDAETYQSMKTVDKPKTREAIRAAYGCGS